jgi:hypothetical protein
VSRFILRFRGAEQTRAADVARIRALPHIAILDDSSPRMLLVEAPEEELKSLMESMPDWVMAPERYIPLPDSQPKLREKR